MLKPTRKVPELGERTRRSIDLIAMLAFCGFLFFAGLQVIGLVGADEPRFAQVAREMMQRHDWVTPTLFGHTWFEKPPLFYWCAILAYRATNGVFDWAARLPSAALTSLMVFLVYLWTRRFFKGMQLDAALITASSAMVIGFGRAASTDMPLTVAFTLSMLSWYGWYLTRHRGWLLVFYLAAAFGTLAKGPVAVLLAGLIIVAFAALRRDLRLIARTLWWPAVLLYLAGALPWYIAVQRANPDFFRIFILQHNLERYTTDLYRHTQPFWYYLPVALLALVPWTVFVIVALVDAIRDWRYSATEEAGREDFRTYLAIWFLVPIVFFTFSHSKLPGYILPGIPAGTILLADFIRRQQEAEVKPAWWLTALHCLLCAGLLVGALLVPFKLLKLPVPMNVIVVAVTLAVITILFLWATLQNQGYRVLRFATLVPVVILFALLLRGTAPWVNALASARPVAGALTYTGLNPIPLLAVYDVPRSVEYGLGFYRNRPVLSYERNEIPASVHLVVAAEGTKTELEYRLGGRKVTRIGGYALQHLEFYLVAAKDAGTEKP